MGRDRPAEAEPGRPTPAERPFLPQIKSGPHVDEPYKPRTRLAKPEAFVLCGTSATIPLADSQQLNTQQLSHRRLPQPTVPSATVAPAPAPPESARATVSISHMPRLVAGAQLGQHSQILSARSRAQGRASPSWQSARATSDHLPRIMCGPQALVIKDADALACHDAAEPNSSSQNVCAHPNERMPNVSAQGSLPQHAPQVAVTSQPDLLESPQVAPGPCSSSSAALPMAKCERQLDVIKTAAMTQRMLIQGHRADPKAYFIEPRARVDQVIRPPRNVAEAALTPNGAAKTDEHAPAMAEARPSRVAAHSWDEAGDSPDEAKNPSHASEHVQSDGGPIPQCAQCVIGDQEDGTLAMGAPWGTKGEVKRVAVDEDGQDRGRDEQAATHIEASLLVSRPSSFAIGSDVLEPSSSMGLCPPTVLTGAPFDTKGEAEIVVVDEVGQDRGREEHAATYVEASMLMSCPSSPAVKLNVNKTSSRFLSCPPSESGSIPLQLEPPTAADKSASSGSCRIFAAHLVSAGPILEPWQGNGEEASSPEMLPVSSFRDAGVARSAAASEYTAALESVTDDEQEAPRRNSRMWIPAMSYSAEMEALFADDKSGSAQRPPDSNATRSAANEQNRCAPDLVASERTRDEGLPLAACAESSLTVHEQAGIEGLVGVEPRQLSRRHSISPPIALEAGATELPEENDEVVEQANRILHELDISLVASKSEMEGGNHLQAMKIVTDIVMKGSVPLPRPSLKTAVCLGALVSKTDEPPPHPAAVVRDERRRLLVASALYERGKMLQKLSLWSSAADDFVKCIEWLPDQSYDPERLGREVRWAKAQLLAEQQAFSECLTALDELLAPPCGHACTWMQLAAAEEVTALELRARCLASLGKDEEALDELHVLIQRHNSLSSARRTAANIYMRRGELHSALRELKAASILMPQDTELCEETLELFAAEVDEKSATIRALEYLDEIIGKHPTSFTLLKRATLRTELAGMVPRSLASQHYAGASSDLDRVLTSCDARHNDVAKAHLYRGCLEAKVKPKRALNDLRLATKLSPTDPRPCLAAASIHESMGSAKLALRAYAEAFRRDSDDPFPLLAMSCIYMFYCPADLDAAVKYASRAIKLRPDYLRAYAVRAEAYSRAGEPEMALRDVCHALHLCPSDLTHKALKADLLLSLGRTREAAVACSNLAAAVAAHVSGATHAVTHERCKIANAEAMSLLGSSRTQLRCRPSLTRAPSVIEAGGRAPGLQRRSSSIIEDDSKAMLQRHRSAIAEGDGPPALQRRVSSVVHDNAPQLLSRRSSSVIGPGGTRCVIVGGEPQIVTQPRHFSIQANLLPPGVTNYRLQVLQAEAQLLTDGAGEAIGLLDRVLDLPRHSGDDAMQRALDLSLLAVAKQIVGDINGALEAIQKAHSSAALASTDRPKDMSTIWLRDGHLRLAMHDMRGALHSYRCAARSNPKSAQAHEGIGWARFNLRMEREWAQSTFETTALEQHVEARSLATDEWGVPDGNESSEDSGEKNGENGDEPSEEDCGASDSISVAGSAAEPIRALNPKSLRRKRNLELKAELAAFKKANKLKKDGMLRAQLHRAFILDRDGQHSRAAGELQKVALRLSSAADKTPEINAQLANVLVFLSVIQLSAGQVAASMLSLQEAMARGAALLRPGPLRLARFAQGTTLMNIGAIDVAAISLSEVTASFDSEHGAPKSRTPSDTLKGASAGQELGHKPREPLSLAALAQRRDAILNFAAHYNLGLALERQDNRTGALRALDAAVKFASTICEAHLVGAIPVARLADCYVAQGMVLLQQGHSERAINAFESALSLRPPLKTVLQALIGLGHAHLDAGNVPGARRMYSRAKLRFPSDPAPQLALARLFLYVNQAVAASRCVATVLLRVPHLPEALEVRAALKLAQRDVGGAIHDLEASLSPNINTNAKDAHDRRSISLSMIRMHLGDQRRARRELDELGREDLNTGALTLNRLRALTAARKLVATGFHAAKRGEWEESANLYDAALGLLVSDVHEKNAWEKDHQDSLASEAVGDFMGSSLAPLVVERKTPNVDPGPQVQGPTAVNDGIISGRWRVLRGRAAFGAGLAYAFLDDRAKALDRFNAAICYRHDCGFTMYNRAVLHLAGGRWDFAEADLKGCVTRLPLIPDGWLKKCEAIIAQGDQGRKAHALSDYANALVVMDFDPRTRIKE